MSVNHTIQLPLFEPWDRMIKIDLQLAAAHAAELSRGVLRCPKEKEPWYDELETDLIVKAFRAEEERWPVAQIIAEIVGNVSADFHKNLHKSSVTDSSATFICSAEIEVVSLLAYRLASDISNTELGTPFYILPGSLGNYGQKNELQDNNPWHHDLRVAFETSSTLAELISHLSQTFAVALSPFTNGSNIRRRPLQLQTDFPIVQVNHPYSDETIDSNVFHDMRVTAESIARKIDASKYLCELPGRYVSFPLDRLPKDPEATMDGSLRSSAVIYLTENARIGTGLSIGLVTPLFCPTLLLTPVGSDPASGFDGNTYGYEQICYTPEDSLPDICCDFLSRNDKIIRTRHEELMRYSQDRIDEITHAVCAAPDAAFDNPLLSKRRAIFWSSDPIRWHQCHPILAQRILSAAGITTNDAVAIGRNESKATMSLLIYGRVNGISAAQLMALWQEATRRSRFYNVGSHKDFGYSLADWNTLYEDMKDSM